MTLGNQANLLRLLEPAARPVGLPGPLAPAPRNIPIEQRSFDALLSEAQKMPTDPTIATTTPPTGDSVNEKPKVGLLHQLARIDRIENGSLLGMIGGVER